MKKVRHHGTLDDFPSFSQLSKGRYGWGGGADGNLSVQSCEISVHKHSQFYIICTSFPLTRGFMRHLIPSTVRGWSRAIHVPKSEGLRD